MKIVVQCVKKASCTVSNKIVSKIDRGFMLLVGIGLDDNQDIVAKMANKVNKLRIFEDEQGKINKDIHDINGSILSISQFTLYADCAKGNRPSFNNALSGEKAINLYQYFNECLRSYGLEVQEGIFGADMDIELINEGPKTILMDSKELIK